MALARPRARPEEARTIRPPVLPDLTLLVALVLGLSAYGSTGEPTMEPWKAIAGTAAAVLVVATLCRMAADRAIRAVEDQDGRALLSAGRSTGLIPFVGWGLVIFVFDWGSLVGDVVPRTWFLLPILLLFAPLALMVSSAWVAARRVEARFDPLHAPTSWGAVKRGLRRNAIVLVPMLILLALQEALFVLDAWKVPGFRTIFLWHEAFPDTEAVVVLGLLVVLSWFGPEIVRRILRAKPLEDGEARREMENLCATIGVRCKDILLWDTKGRVLNAMVVGLTGGTRYVFVTDALLAALPRPEALAVVAHEAGHAKLRHLPAYFALSLSLMLLLRSAEELALPLLPQGADLLLSLLSLAFFWFVMLGWLSRRFERQADVFGATHAGALTPDAPPTSLEGLSTLLPFGTAMMISALQRISAHAAPGRHHRHGPPLERMAYLAAYATQEPVRREFGKDSRRIRAGLWLVALVALASTAARIPGGIVRGHATLALREGLEASQAGDVSRKSGDAAGAAAHYATALDRYQASARFLEERPDDLGLLAVAVTATWNAADTTIHHGVQPLDAAAGFERTLRLLERLGRRSRGGIDVLARIELGRLALRDPVDPPAGVDRARKWLAEATAVPDAEFDGAYRSARQRLLESAIRLRDPDASVADQARRDLEHQTKPAGDSEEWQELARDAAEELHLAPPRKG